MNTVTGRIVVGIDGSEPSMQALRWARYLAEVTACSLDVVAAWMPFAAYEWFGAGWAAMPAGWDPARDTEKAVTSSVDEVFGEHRPSELRIIVSEGRPAKVLLEASAGARMLVVGSRGHGGFTGLLLGSVSAACSEHAECPVLVVHGSTPAPG
jgi:nucleotide-binding universal stress UspA family protein